jgi:hypothetical protein
MGRLHEKMFVAQTTLETWLESGKVEFDGTVVTLTRHRRTYDLQPAVQFLSVVEGHAETDLVGKVIPEHKITELGGEILGDSVIFGELAFHVRQGYIAILRNEGAS